MNYLISKSNYLNKSISEFSIAQINNNENIDLYKKLILWMIYCRDVTTGNN
jgi:hypothetical protein